MNIVPGPHHWIPDWTSLIVPDLVLGIGDDLLVLEVNANYLVIACGNLLKIDPTTYSDNVTEKLDRFNIIKCEKGLAF